MEANDKMLTVLIVLYDAKTTKYKVVQLPTIAAIEGETRLKE